MILSNKGPAVQAGLLSIFVATCQADTIVQTVGNIDWNAAMWGTPAAAPTPGNTYVTATGVQDNRFRLSATGTASTFGGDSITVTSGIRALMKNQNGTASTVNGDFTLDGGRLSHAPNSGPHAGTLDVANFIVTGTGSFIDINGVSTFTIDGVLTGDGDLLLRPELAAGGTISFTEVNNYTGALTVQPTIRLDFNSDYTFTNSLTLEGSAVLNVDQNLSIEAAYLTAGGNPVPAGVYTGADITNLGPNFEDGGGTLTVFVTDTDGDGLTDAEEQLIIDFDANDAVDGFEDVAGPNDFPTITDFDGDGRSDADEITGGSGGIVTSPVNADSDGDGLLDGPEVAGTDNDGNSHGFGPTDPNATNSDDDVFNDLVEVRYGANPNDGASVPADTVALTNAGFEEPILDVAGFGIKVSEGNVPGWTVVENDFYLMDFFDFASASNPNSASEGFQFATPVRNSPEVDVEATELIGGDAATMSMMQIADVSSIATALDEGDRSLILGFDWFDEDPADQGRVSLTFRDGSGNDLGRSAAFVTPNGGQQWNTSTVVGFPPVGTRSVVITLEVFRISGGGGTVRNVHFDNLRAYLGDFDFDGDGLPDGWEELYGLNPEYDADAALSADADSLSNLQEFGLGTDPTLADTDGDGINDDVEVTNGSDPLDANSPSVDIAVVGIESTTDANGQVTRVAVTFSGLNTNRTYELRRGSDLTGITEVVDTFQPTDATFEFVDTTPLDAGVSAKAFYQLAEQ